MEAAENPWAHEKSWREVREYLDSGQDLVLLPVGSVEQYDPHIPIGHDVSPTIKVTANPRPAARMAENTDLDISGVMRGELSRDEAVGLLHEELTAVLNGKKRGRKFWRKPKSP